MCRALTLSLGCCAVLGAAVACARGPSGTLATAGARDRSVMDSTDLVGRHYPNVQEAIIAAHPEWLAARSGARPVMPVPGSLPRSAAGIGIFLDDDKQPMTMDYLRTLQVEQVVRIKHLSGSEAMATYGPQWVSGAIVVTLRR